MMGLNRTSLGVYDAMIAEEYYLQFNAKISLLQFNAKIALQ